MLLHILLPNALIVSVAVINLIDYFCKERTSTSSRVEYLHTMELALFMLHAICGSPVAALLHSHLTFYH